MRPVSISPGQGRSRWRCFSCRTEFDIRPLSALCPFCDGEVVGMHRSTGLTMQGKMIATEQKKVRDRARAVAEALKKLQAARDAS